ncbi:hypothetical protein [Streptomyces sp. CB01881]|nr:hypothetical protein [Streptomyces sp. CB01881]
MTELPAAQRPNDVEAVEPLRVWTACAVSVTALLHLAAAALVLTTRSH